MRSSLMLAQEASMLVYADSGPTGRENLKVKLYAWWFIVLGYDHEYKPNSVQRWCKYGIFVSYMTVFLLQIREKCVHCCSIIDGGLNQVQTWNHKLCYFTMSFLHYLCKSTPHTLSNAISSYVLQSQKKCRYRFSVLIDELSRAETPEYKCTLLAFINCIIIHAGSVEERVRIRNEFIGKSVFALSLRGGK